MVYNSIYTPNAQSIIPHRPDVLRCSESNHLFYLDDKYNYQYMDNRHNVYLSFNSDGTFSHSYGDRSKSYLCAGKSLSDLEHMGLAYNLVSSKEANAEDTTFAPHTPDAIMCDGGKMLYRTSPGNNVYWTLDNTFYSQALTFDLQTGENKVESNRGKQVSSCEYKSLAALYREGRGFNLVTSSGGPDESGFSSVHAGWPDVITCGPSYFYLSFDDENENSRYYVNPVALSRPPNQADINAVRFSLDEQKAIQVPLNHLNITCLGKTISDFYNEGNAFNLVSGYGTKRYFFEYKLEDVVFSGANLTQVPTDTVTSQGGGKLTNCAKGVATMERSVSLSIANQQSVSFSKSFTSTAALSVAEKTSITANFEANAIFWNVKMGSSVAPSAGLDVTETFTSSASRTDSMTLSTTSTIGFELSTSVEVRPESCAEYALATQVSAIPIRVPFGAVARLAVYDWDPHRGAPGYQVMDLSKLQHVLDLLNADRIEGYHAVLDDSDSTIVYNIEGLYTGKYATRSETKVRPCDLNCDSWDDYNDSSDPSYAGGSVSFAAATAGDSSAYSSSRGDLFGTTLCLIFMTAWSWMNLRP